MSSETIDPDELFYQSNRYVAPQFVFVPLPSGDWMVSRGYGQNFGQPRKITSAEIPDFLDHAFRKNKNLTEAQHKHEEIMRQQQATPTLDLGDFKI